MCITVRFLARGYVTMIPNGILAMDDLTGLCMLCDITVEYDQSKVFNNCISFIIRRTAVPESLSVCLIPHFRLSTVTYNGSPNADQANTRPVSSLGHQKLEVSQVRIDA